MCWMSSASFRGGDAGVVTNGFEKVQSRRVAESGIGTTEDVLSPRSWTAKAQSPHL
ncbi:MAG: hypothetical protein ACLUIR_04045 [Faecalibacterium prausnitzii]